MVQNTGKTLYADTVKPINLPEPVQVEESDSGLPTAIRTPRRQVITAIEDRWRIDDEWWRRDPVSRMYYVGLLTSGQRLVIYKDLNDNRWYKQTY
jgi:hypothetical protein